MNIQDKHDILLEKLYQEQEEYKKKLCELTPEEILEHSYAYATKEDILVAFEYMSLSDEQMDALMESPCPLDDIYNEYCEIESGYMDIIREAISESANIAITQKAARI